MGIEDFIKCYRPTSKLASKPLIELYSSIKGLTPKGFNINLTKAECFKLLYGSPDLVNIETPDDKVLNAIMAGGITYFLLGAAAHGLKSLRAWQDRARLQGASQAPKIDA
jgi:hypothetical protein